MDQRRLCAYLSQRQGLCGLSTATNRSVLANHGWARSVGGQNAYMSLFARNRSSATQAEFENNAGEIYEFASARGCTYFLPKEHFQAGIKAGQGFNDAAAIRTAKSKLGVTDDDIERLKDGILRVLSDGALDNSNIKKALGDLVVNFGEAGKKVGQTTNLSLGILSLQAEAKIRRIPKGGKLDTEIYSYEIYSDAPVVDESYSKEAAYEHLASLFWQWIGVASLGHFQWFSGLSQKLCKEAISTLELDQVPGTDLLILSDEVDTLTGFEAPELPTYRLVTSLDSIFLLRREVQSLFHPELLKVVATMDDKNGPSLGVKDLPHHAILDRGMIIGLWEYEVSSGSIVYFTAEKMTDQLESEIRTTQDFIQTELGDCKTHSLDSPKSRQGSIDKLRSMSN